MNHDYAKLVVWVAKVLSESPLGLSPLEMAVSDRKVPTLNDPTRARILKSCLIQLDLCDRDGNVLNPAEFQMFLYQVQGAVWAYEDAKILTPRIQLVMTEPDWISQSKIRRTEDIFRDLIQTATHSLWIVNPFFSIDSPQVMNLFALIASRLQQGNISIRLILRRVAPNRREFALPALRRLCNLVPKHYLKQLNTYSLDLNEGVERQTFHSKIMVRDDIAAYIGSANWTESSLQGSVELGVLVEGQVIQQQLVPVLQTLLSHAEPIVLETLQ
jgi:phosphatidylserine/phosphatidylglycerophosphate/cardiolipin synthase-like enzyme